MHPPVLLKLLAFALPLFEQADDLTRSLRQYHNAFVLPFGGFRGFSVHGLTRGCQPTGWNAEVISKFPPIFRGRRRSGKLKLAAGQKSGINEADDGIWLASFKRSVSCRRPAGRR
jgi:hypothetical protein